MASDSAMQQSAMGQFCDELLDTITTASSGVSKQQLSNLKISLSKKYNLRKIPTDIEVMMHLPQERLPEASKILLTKPVRTISGVAPIAVMTPPYGCPHGKCTFCPGGPGSFFGDVPQSYTGHEPSTMRARRNNYDPYLIVMNRLEHLTSAGHSPNKAELIIQGGTFPAIPIQEQDRIIAYCFKAMNDFSKLFYVNGKFDIAAFKEFFILPGTVSDQNRIQKIRQSLLSIKANVEVNVETNVEANAKGAVEGNVKDNLKDNVKANVEIDIKNNFKDNDFESRLPSLSEEQKKNELSDIRCVALAIETKPDWGLEQHALQMLRLGTTRVELGIQTTYEKPLKITNRGHTLQDSIDSTRILKDFGFKITYHIMLGLPEVTREMDIECIKTIFSNPDYMPDSLKIYPCMVMPGTPMHIQWQKGQFKPIDAVEAADRIAFAKRFVPEWCRIMRVQRDIPSTVVTDGVKKTNLRQYVGQSLEKYDYKCRCIRCREPKGKAAPQNFEFKVVSYAASGGTEFFISAEDKERDVLLGFCRLRIPCKAMLPELANAAVVRELHVYGKAQSFGVQGNVQHRGIGRKLMDIAENISKDYSLKNLKKIAVISGIGVREYYRKIGYELEGFYMTKNL